MRQTLANVQHTLERAGSSLQDVVRVTMHTTDLGWFDQIGPVHREVFGQARPAATMVEVKRLAHPDLLFEAEVTAVPRAIAQLLGCRSVPVHSPAGASRTLFARHGRMVG